MAASLKHRKKRNGTRRIIEPEPERAFARRFIVLTPEFQLWELPEHPLAIPSGWARELPGDYRTSDGDFCPRETALAQAAADNRLALAEHENDCFDPGPQDVKWSLVFEIGAIEGGSFINIEGGVVASLHIDTTLSLVRPTAEELARFAGAGKAVSP